jgi:hypothetical protein|tara:strand:+ start:160 stop:366 length:207 start_codon:yes stop_codon:yes gene_type:complete
MIELSAYYGSEQYDDRKATVLWDDVMKEYYIDMRKEGFSKMLGMSRHSEQYAEDCAENFVMGYGEFGR